DVPGKPESRPEISVGRLPKPIGSGQRRYLDQTVPGPLEKVRAGTEIEVRVEQRMGVMLDPEAIPSDAEVECKARPHFPVIADIARYLIEAIAVAKLWRSDRQRYRTAGKLTLGVDSNLELMELAGKEVVQRFIDAGS